MAITTTHLATGWGPDTDAGDSLLRRFVLHSADQYAAFATAAGGRSTLVDTFAAADYGRPSGYFNFAVLLQPPARSDSEATFEAIEAFFADGTGSVHILSPWPVPQLASRGWKLEGHPPLLIRPPAARVAPPPAPPADVRRVTDASRLADWERVAIEGFPMPELLPVETGSLTTSRILDDDRFQLRVGYIDDMPVSIGTLFVSRDLASLALGVTRPEARGRGHWKRHAIERLEAAPELWAAGIFSDYSRPGAEALGFIPIMRFDLWTQERNGTDDKKGK